MCLGVYLYDASERKVTNAAKILNDCFLVEPWIVAIRGRLKVQLGVYLSETRIFRNRRTLGNTKRRAGISSKIFAADICNPEAPVSRARTEPRIGKTMMLKFFT